MAYLSDKGYKHDLAISYARRDNAAFANDNWISSFYDKLQTRLLTISGEDIDMWRDVKEITGNEYFDQTLQDTFRNSAILITCFSNSYIKSEYCRKEIRYFYRTIQEPNDPFGLLINNKSRLFNILLYDIPKDQWLEPLMHREGYKFFDEELRMPLSTQSPEFDHKISVLAKDVWQLLSNMNRQDAIRKKIFFASAPRNVGLYSDQLREALSKRARLAPNKILASFEQLQRTEVKDILNDACSSIHLFGCNGDEDEMEDKFKDTHNYYFISQAEAALETDKPQLIWYPKNSNNNKAPHVAEKAFFERLELAQGKKEKDLEIIEGLPADVCRAVDSWVEKYINKVAEPQVNFWLVDAKPEEIENRDELADEIKKRHQPLLNYQRSDQLNEAFKKTARYILVINMFTYSSVDRLEIVAKSMNSMPAGRKLGIYLAPSDRRLDKKQIERIKEYQSGGFIVYDANGYGLSDNINSLSEFIQQML